MPKSLSADDRFAVLEVIQRYAHACDSGEFERFDETFTADAELDYRSAGGPLGDRDQLREWLAKSRSGLLMWQHLLSPPLLGVRGDAVHARTDVYTPNLFRGAGGQVGILHTGGRYHDELVATPRGWRISRRCYENVWVHGAGAGDAIPDPLRGA